MKILLILFIIAAFVTKGISQIHTETVEYKSGNTILKGFLAYDQNITGKHPGVLIVHDWTGLGDYPKMRAEQLAKLGYIAFAADIYGNGIVAKNMDDAAKLAGQYSKDRTAVRERMNAALKTLEENKFVDANKVAAIGYCFGGMCVLELARSGADIKGVVTFHGNLSNPNPDDAKNIKAKILVCTGADDPYVNKEQVENFKKEMDDAKVDWQMDIYSGAVHAFTIPTAGNDNSKGAAYNEKADKRSWQVMMDFFDEIFK
jgi:dienelactone hydrolase